MFQQIVIKNLNKITVAEGNDYYQVSNDGKFLLVKESGTLALVCLGGESLTKIDFTDSGVKIIPKEPLWGIGDWTLTELNLSGVEHVEQQAFYNKTKLTSITWGNTLKSIGNMAFYRADVTSINLPESVLAIAYNAFQRSASDSNPISEFKIGGVSASDATQPSGWYKLTESSTWKSYISTKPTSITADGTKIISLSVDSTENVLATIQANTCGTSGSGYYYCLK